jgi:hypothetical protein
LCTHNIPLYILSQYILVHNIFGLIPDCYVCFHAFNSPHIAPKAPSISPLLLQLAPYTFQCVPLSSHPPLAPAWSSSYSAIPPDFGQP